MASTADFRNGMVLDIDGGALGDYVLSARKAG